MSGAGTGAPLARVLGTSDAVVVGLGAMVGAGVFVALAPAAAVAGSLLLVGLAVAAAVATCNALSSAQLAAVHPESGGTYVYGRRRLGPAWGHLAGFGFVVGKTASCAAMALAVGTYAAPSASRPVAVLAVVALTAVGLCGLSKTARVARVLLVAVLAVLALVVVSALASSGADPARLTVTDEVGVRDVLQSAGLLFFAFAGYARIATLGGEVREPERTIPRAVGIALVIALLVYACVATSALLAVGPEVLAASPAPLAAVVEAGSWPGLAAVVRAGAAVASLGVLLSLLAGVSRTAFAMAGQGDLPRWLHATSRVGVPHRAETAVAVGVVVLVLAVDLRMAVGFSSFAVLTYYAITNAAALTLAPHERRWPRWVPTLGLVGCVVLATTLPTASVLSGTAVLAGGVLLRAVTTAVPGRTRRPSRGRRTSARRR